jgi:hypothetical protein
MFHDEQNLSAVRIGCHVGVIASGDICMWFFVFVVYASRHDDYHHHHACDHNNACDNHNADHDGLRRWRGHLLLGSRWRDHGWHSHYHSRNRRNRANNDRWG